MHPFLQSFLGGLLIGAAVWLMLAGLGRVTGVSGIAATALAQFAQPRRDGWRYAFLAGLIGGGLVFTRLFGEMFAIVAVNVTTLPGLIFAGLLVGFGTTVGSGCTSGHGVCGLGRRSLRSLVATIVFMAAGMATVALIRALGVSA